MALIDIFKIMKSLFHFVFTESLWEWPCLALAVLELIYIHLICLSENSGDRFLELQIRIRSEENKTFSLEDIFFISLLLSSGRVRLSRCYANAGGEIIPGCQRYHFISCHLSSPGIPGTWLSDQQMHISTLLNTNGSCIFSALGISNKPNTTKYTLFLLFKWTHYKSCKCQWLVYKWKSSECEGRTDCKKRSIKWNISLMKSISLNLPAPLESCDSWKMMKWETWNSL